MSTTGRIPGPEGHLLGRGWGILRPSGQERAISGLGGSPHFLTDGVYCVEHLAEIPHEEGTPAMPTTNPAPLAPASRRVVLVDDHGAIVEMLKQVVELIPGYRVIGHAAEVGAALELCRREQPDIIVLDIMMPPTSGLALLGELRGACPLARVLIFSGHLPPAAIQRALSWGVHGLVGKMAALDEFRHALQAVGSGQVYFSRAASEEIRNLVNFKAARVVRLTERESLHGGRRGR